MYTPIIGPTWRGSASIEHLVIFGDSYSSVGYSHHSSHPTREEPLGIKFPGFTWAESGKPNWVGHYVTNYSPNPSLLVHDYACGGHTVDGVERQIRLEFLPYVADKPDWVPWESNNTLFVTWVGINDCAYTSDFSGKMQRILDLHEELYQTGARNFLFIDVPPIHRSPAFPTESDGTDHSERYRGWNSALQDTIAKFSANHPDVTSMTFSSWDTFNRILDDPKKHGFPKRDIRARGGSIWMDYLHPTSRIHDFIARDISMFLNSQPAYEGK